MTVTELNQKLETLKEKCKFKNDVYLELRNDKQKDLKLELSKYFEKHLLEDMMMDVYDDVLYIKRKEVDRNYHKELVSIYFRNVDYKTKIAKEIETSFYSTTGNSQYELERMVVIGKIGQVLLEKSEEILNTYNEIQSSYKDTLNNNSKLVWELEDEIRELKYDIKQAELQQIKDIMKKDGLKFEVKEGDSIYPLPNIDVRFDCTRKNVSKIKIVKETASGKSADLEITTLREIYDYESQEYKIEETVIINQNIRMSNIDQFLLKYRDRISIS